MKPLVPPQNPMQGRLTEERQRTKTSVPRACDEEEGKRKTGEDEVDCSSRMWEKNKHLWKHLPEDVRNAYRELGMARDASAREEMIRSSLSYNFNPIAIVKRIQANTTEKEEALRRIVGKGDYERRRDENVRQNNDELETNSLPRGSDPNPYPDFEVWTESEYEEWMARAKRIQAEMEAERKREDAKKEEERKERERKERERKERERTEEELRKREMDLKQREERILRKEEDVTRRERQLREKEMYFAKQVAFDEARIRCLKENQSRVENGDLLSAFPPRVQGSVLASHPNLSNLDPSPIVVSASCIDSYFAYPNPVPQTVMARVVDSGTLNQMDQRDQMSKRQRSDDRIMRARQKRSRPIRKRQPSFDLLPEDKFNIQSYKKKGDSSSPYRYVYPSKGLYRCEVGETSKRTRIGSWEDARVAAYAAYLFRERKMTREDTIQFLSKNEFATGTREESDDELLNMIE